MSLNDFIILNTLGMVTSTLLSHNVGSGSFADVMKVKRKSDGLVYALKKVSYSDIKSYLIFGTGQHAQPFS